MNKGSRAKITNIIELMTISAYLILNITSAIFDLPVYVSTNQRIVITVIILLCNLLIYIFLKNRIIIKLILFYWMFLLIVVLGNIIRLIYPLSIFSIIHKKTYVFSRYFISMNTLLYLPGSVTFNGFTITSSTIFLIATTIVFIILYLIKIIKQNKSVVTA